MTSRPYHHVIRCYSPKITSSVVKVRGSHITTAHEQQCCRFQSYAESVPSPMKLTKRNWQSVNDIPGIHDNGPRDQGLWRLTLTAYAWRRMISLDGKQYSWAFAFILSNTTSLSSFPCEGMRVQGSANTRRMPAMIAHLTWMIYLGQSRARAHHALQPRITNLV